MRVGLVLVCATAMAGPAVRSERISLTFEPNTGQASKEVLYLARSSAYTLYLGLGETVLAGRHGGPLRTRLAGANLAAQASGEELQASRSNYFLGNDPAKWRSGVSNYGRVRYHDVYPGIDLVYYGKDGILDYDWIVGAGADPRRIRMVFAGSERLRIDGAGDLVVGEYRHKHPVVYQEVEGKRVAVTGRWMLRGREAGFVIGKYDRDKILVIDPPLTYSTYFGGSGLDAAYAVAVDSIGSTYITGAVGSTTVQGASVGLRGTEDIFVTKLNPAGGKSYTTYIGGAAVDEGHGIAVDVQGNAYITGTTTSLDFPLKNALQATQGGSGDAVVVKLNATGGMVYSTYLGGNGTDIGSGIAVDGLGNAYIVGSTFSTNLPVVAAYQQSKGAQQDAFVAKINAAGTKWLYVTYLGGNDVDQGNGIAVDASGNAYITGYTESTNFPVQSPLRGSNGGSVDAFITKINPAGSALVYSTYLGGTGIDYGTAIAVDASGNAYVTGITGSDDFPLASPIDNLLGSHAVDDAFVAKLNPSGSGLMFSTYLGGASGDDPYAIAVDSSGNIWVTGRTNSSDFPLTNPIQATRTAFDMFVTEISASGTQMLFSTFIGGRGEDVAHGIAVDYLGNVHIAGETTSPDFPVVNPVQGTNGGGGLLQDGVVLMLGTAQPFTGPVITTVSDNLVLGGPVVPGGWFYVQGTGLSDVQRIWGGSDFSDPNTLPTNLNGVEVWVNGRPVPVYFISPTQVNAQAPADVSGSMTVQVFRLGLGSNILNAPVAQIAPSVYNYQVSGKKYAAALFQDYSLMGDPAVTPGTHKAKAGDVIQLYVAGLGPAQSGSAVSSPVPISGVTVNIGSTSATVLGAYLVASGQYQVNFTVPSIADGEYVITVSISGKTSPADVLFEVG